MPIFTSLTEAIAAGYMIVRLIPGAGYELKQRFGDRWEFAYVSIL